MLTLDSIQVLQKWWFINIFKKQNINAELSYIITVLMMTSLHTNRSIKIGLISDFRSSFRHVQITCGAASIFRFLPPNPVLTACTAHFLDESSISFKLTCIPCKGSLLVRESWAHSYNWAVFKRFQLRSKQFPSLKAALWVRDETRNMFGYFFSEHLSGCAMLTCPPGRILLWRPKALKGQESKST